MRFYSFEYRSRLMAASSAACLALALPMQAQAQSAPADPAGQPAAQSADDTGSGDILVTARRETERLQDIPLTVSAISADELAKRGSVDLQDVANYTPGLRFTDFLSKFNGNAVIRGLSQTNVQSAIGNVGVFMDGIYLQRGYMVDSQLGDLDRIEVVKGPQSALYGQNSFSGLINYVMRQPTDELKVNGQASVGNGDYTDFRLGVGGPIIPGLLDARVYYARADYGGTWKNNYPGADSSDMSHFSGYKRRNYSASLKLTPMDGLTITGSYNRLERSEKIRAFYTIDGTNPEDFLNCGATGTYGKRIWCGNLPNSPDGKHSGVNASNYPSGLFAVPQPGMTSKSEVYHAALQYVISRSLTFNYDYGNTHGEAVEQSTFASNSLNPTTGRNNLQREGGLLSYNSHDARFTFNNGGPLKIDFGGFHSYAEDSFLFGYDLVGVPEGQVLLGGNTDPTSAGGLFLFSNRTTKYGTTSGYLRGSYDLFDDRLTLAAEGRYTHTQLSTKDHQTPTLAALEATYNNFAPRFSVQYKPSSDTMFYVSAAKGVKAGGFNGYVTGNITLRPEERSFGEEENWTYEGGIKGSAFDHRLTYTASIFYIDWSKRQVAAPPQDYVYTGPGTAVPSIYVSGGAARSKGIELSGSYRYDSHLRLNGSFTWQRATATTGSVAYVANQICDDVVCSSTGDTRGNFLGNVPWLQGAGGFEYRGQLTSSLEYLFGADEVFRGKMYVDQTNTASIAPYWLTNTHIGIQAKNWSASLWTKNLFDRQYVDASFFVSSSYQYNVNLGERRTIGLTLSLNY